MKGVCLIICLMLARDIAGSIFRPQFDPRMANLVVQPLELLSDHQNIEQHQRNKHHHPRHQHVPSDVSASRSEDSRERTVEDDTSSEYHHLNAPIHAWNSALYSAVIGQPDEQQTYTNVRSWRGNQITDVPSLPVTNEKNYDKYSIFYDAFNTMKHMTDDQKKRFHESYQTAAQTSNEDVHLNAPQLLEKHNYQVEEHTVKSDDGYILTLFRIPPKKNYGHESWSNKEQSKEYSKETRREESNEHYNEHPKRGENKYHSIENSHEPRGEENREKSKERSEEASKELNTENSKQHSEEYSKERSANVQKAPVVFLMHGLLGSADDWLLMGPGKSLAYLLADAGFDVWLGNARGNKYSRQHVSKHPAQPDFWQFTTDEIALHDLPAMIDYVLNETKHQKLVYVGHSQGTTAFFALTSSRPEYNEKVQVMYAISPMVYMENAPSSLLRMIAANYHIHGDFNDGLLGNGEFNPNKNLIELAGGNMCQYQIGCKEACSNIYFVMAGINPDDIDVSRIPVIMGHLPAGTSIRQVKQYGQAAANHEFRKYDYGEDINEHIYGQRVPPTYDMSKVRVPVALYYSEKDWLAHPKDVDRLRQELPNVVDAYKVPEKQFTHTDFQFSKKAPEVVYKKLIKSIKKVYE